MYNSNYVLDGFVGNDIMREINTYTVNPIEESRNVHDEALIARLDQIYDKFGEQSHKRIKSLQRHMDTCRDYETSFEISETIADVYFDLERISYEGLMRYQPKVNKEELIECIRKVCN